ncbi:MAG: DUF1565 domain-containing protein, partial [Candidatus Moranbacteria bacterium]|nr:DUF1565 domain-containing protein [Candidatus Moranbacteria bacterium]
MQRFQKILFFCGGLGLSFFIAQTVRAAGPTEIKSDITTETVWTKEGSPYVIKSDGIKVNALLTIEPGVVVKFDYSYNSRAKLEINSELIAIGNENERIIFTSIRDDSFGGDTNLDGDITIPKSGDWNSIHFTPGSRGVIDYATVSYGVRSRTVWGEITIIGTNNVSIRNSEIKNSGYYGIFLYNSSSIIENNIISNNKTGISLGGNKKAVMRNNFIAGNVECGALISGIPISLDQLDARDNWWGDVSGPYYKRGLYGYVNEDNLEGKGNCVNDGVLFNPWLQKSPVDEDVACQENCHSNVLFLPGIKASRLYKYDSETDKDLDELWVPNW